MTHSSERRKNRRVSCSEGDYFFIPMERNKKHPCNLKNISITGACIETADVLDINKNIILHLCRDRDLAFNSRVVWKDGDTYGILFLLESPQELTDISFIINNQVI